jgi:hypothetical protein
MYLKYVVERIEGEIVTHIGASSVQEAEQILRSIPKKDRGQVYPLYLKEILNNEENKEDEQ